MRLTTRSLLAVALLAGLPLAANAESQFVSGTGSASAKLDFEIKIPRILFLQVGTGTAAANNVSVDKITFDMTATPAAVGDGTVQSGTGGDLSNGVVTAKVLGNNGNVTLTATAAGALTNATADTIPYSEIVTTATSNTTGTVLAAPVLSNGASAPVTLTAVSKVVNQDAKWTFTYKNTNTVAPGTYGGGGTGNTGNGRVTYTASMP